MGLSNANLIEAHLANWWSNPIDMIMELANKWSPISFTIDPPTCWTIPMVGTTTWSFFDSTRVWRRKCVRDVVLWVLVGIVTYNISNQYPENKISNGTSLVSIWSPTVKIYSLQNLPCRKFLKKCADLKWLYLLFPDSDLEVFFFLKSTNF